MGYQEGRSLAICPWGRAPPEFLRRRTRRRHLPLTRRRDPEGKRVGSGPSLQDGTPLPSVRTGAQALVHTRGPAADPGPAALTVGAWLSLSKCGLGSKLTSTATQTRGGHWGRGRWVLSTNTHTDTHGTAHARTHAPPRREHAHAKAPLLARLAGPLRCGPASQAQGWSARGGGGKRGEGRSSHSLDLSQQVGSQKGLEGCEGECAQVTDTTHTHTHTRPFRSGLGKDPGLPGGLEAMVLKGVGRLSSARGLGEEGPGDRMAVMAVTIGEGAWQLRVLLWLCVHSRPPRWAGTTCSEPCFPVSPARMATEGPAGQGASEPMRSHHSGLSQGPRPAATGLSPAPPAPAGPRMGHTCAQETQTGAAATATGRGVARRGWHSAKPHGGLCGSRSSSQLLVDVSWT